MTVPKTKTFSSPEAAIADTRKLFERGEITEAEFKKVVRQMQEAQLKGWLTKTYGA